MLFIKPKKLSEIGSLKEKIKFFNTFLYRDPISLEPILEPAKLIYDINSNKVSKQYFDFELMRKYIDENDGSCPLTKQEIQSMYIDREARDTAEELYFGIIRAIDENDIDSIKLWINYGGKIETSIPQKILRQISMKFYLDYSRDVFYLSLYFGKLSITRFILDNNLYNKKELLFNDKTAISELFIAAAMNNKKATISFLLENEQDCNCYYSKHNKYIITPLFTAIGEKNFDLANTLLENGANPNMEVSINNELYLTVQMLPILLSSDNEDNSDVDNMKLLHNITAKMLNHNSDICFRVSSGTCNSLNILDMTIKFSDIYTFNLLLEKHKSKFSQFDLDFSLLMTIMCGKYHTRLSMINKLLAHGANPNSLIKISSTGQIIDDPNVNDNCIISTPFLSVLRREKSVNIFNLLISHGANLELQEYLSIVNISYLEGMFTGFKNENNTIVFKYLVEKLYEINQLKEISVDSLDLANDFFRTLGDKDTIHILEKTKIRKLEDNLLFKFRDNEVNNNKSCELNLPMKKYD